MYIIKVFDNKAQLRSEKIEKLFGGNSKEVFKTIQISNQLKLNKYKLQNKLKDSFIFETKEEAKFFIIYFFEPFREHSENVIIYHKLTKKNLITL